LRTKANKDKKVAVYYFKGPGSHSLVASGLEVLPSLYNFLKKLQSEGYDLSGLPASEKEFEKLVMERGPVFNSYAEGNIERYLHSGHPELIPAADYDSWLRRTLLPEQYAELTAKHGAAPGAFYTAGDSIAVTRIRFGNIVLLPQPTQSTGENTFAAVHGDNPIPPHHYLASYLWTRYGFGADAMLHFGTHGSLEFIPGKQVALSTADWSDRLVGDLPHFYLYTIGDVGEGIIAKRRTYAATVSHLTPPFIETEMRGEVGQLLERIKNYLAKEESDRSANDNLHIKRLALKMGLHRDLKLDSVPNRPYTDEEIERIENFAEELCSEKIAGGMYTLGAAFPPEKIRSSVELLATDPIAYGLAALDKATGKVTQKQIDRAAFFNRRYRTPARQTVERLLIQPAWTTEAALTSLGISPKQLARARQIQTLSQPKNRLAMLRARPAAPSAVPTDTLSAAEKAWAEALTQIADAVTNVRNYHSALEESPNAELTSLVRALNGGYLAPTPGGDYIANPNTLPTGRNLYSINAEATPSPDAWAKGVAMGEQMLADYLKNHGGNYPQKVSFTLWSGAFIESEGATIAQILWLLGVEPIRDQFGRVMDIRLVPASELNRPRIDVVVQTSGQLRDLAASRLALIQKAVDLTAALDDGENYVAQGRLAAEKVLLEKGFSPKAARELSTRRIFGGLNGMTGTGITALVESGDRWESDNEIAATYLNNMGAVYGSSETWGDFRAGVFEAALQNTDAVVQPRQSHTWGALSLDHVYEFMGGLNLTVRNVTGRDPDTYFNDLRNRHHARVQELKEAIGVESRTTIFNPVYIREQMKGGASSAGHFTEIVRNTYGWNVMKPAAIDNEMWDRIYDIYVEDELNLGTQTFFERENPAALQEITAVMLETARKGYWQATPEQLKTIAELHSELVTRHEAACSGFTCDNAKLRDFIGRQLTPEEAETYRTSVDRALSAAPSEGTEQQGTVLEKETLNRAADTRRPFGSLGIALGAFGLICAAAGGIRIIRKLRKRKA
ncbi:cobaltochelatase subunit CobN, partial [uncultured Rikenella sp.]